jgi:hypothetical protein
MHSHAIWTVIAICALVNCADRARGDDSDKARQTIARSVTFLQQDAAKWRAERGCATCHHGTMSVWALGEAKAQGHAVDVAGLADVTQWTKERFMDRFAKPRDPRPGWSLVGVPAIYLGLMSQNLPVLSRDEINTISTHLANHQEEDGAWALPPPANGAPPIWESRETLALMAYLAWEPYVPADPAAAEKARASREKAAAWLSTVERSMTTQAATWRLLLEVRTAQPEAARQSRIDELLKKQNADGGWSQTAEMPSDAFATGQALYALSIAGAKPDQPPIQRAVQFLVASQKEDGSWPMTSRNHPGVETTRNPIRNPIPITYFGAAWATIGLVRSVPATPDTEARRMAAFDQIRAFHGKFETDEAAEGKPVILVDLRYYDISDDELAKFAELLPAFPKLATLQIKSAKLTDAGLAHLKSLPHLHSLSLEAAPITDAGLAHVYSLAELQSLVLKDTKVTDAGLQQLQQALPQTKVER